MKRSLQIEAQFTGVIATGSYENEKPLFRVVETIDDVNGVHTDEFIKNRQQELQTICYGQFKTFERRSHAEKIKKEREDIRFYPRNGEQWPSITSVIGWDDDMFLAPDKLIQYAAQGQVTHYRIAHFLETKEWLDGEKLPECYKWIVILKKGDLKLPVNVGNFPAFFEAYPFKPLESEKTVYLDDLKTAGRYDHKGVPIMNKNWEKLRVLEIPTIFDWKRTKNETKNLIQGCTYATAEKVKQVAIVPVNDKTAQGYSKPTVTQKIGAYFKMFEDKREDFKARFQI